MAIEINHPEKQQIIVWANDWMENYQLIADNLKNLADPYG